MIGARAEGVEMAQFSGRSLQILSAVLAGALAAIVIVVAWTVWGSKPIVAPTSSGSAYARVISSGKIRVGYVSYPPASIVDPNGGAVSGVFPDMLREVGKLTSLQVEFTEEVGYADLIQGLENGRYDVVGGLWANPNRGKMATMSVPVYYTGVGVWVRPNETRFSSNNNWAALNTPKVRIAAIDGSTPLNIARGQFPRATVTTYPNLTPESQLFLDVAQGRVDVFFAEPAVGARFLASNPGALKNIATEHPLRVFASVYLMRNSEPQLKTLLDTAIGELQSSGKAEEIISRYESTPGVFFRPAVPYSNPAAPKP